MRKLVIALLCSSSLVGLAAAAPNDFTAVFPPIKGTITITGTAGSSWLNVRSYVAGVPVSPDAAPVAGAYSNVIDTTKIADGPTTFTTMAWACLPGNPTGGPCPSSTITMGPYTVANGAPPPPLIKDPLQGLITTNVPSRPVLHDQLGINSHDLTGFSTVAASGFGWVRTDAYWDAIEKTAGVYDFSQVVDPTYAALTANNLKPLWVLAYGNPLYGNPVNASSVQSFKNYAVALVRHLPPGQSWEIWNEWTGFGPLTTPQYAALVRAVIPAIHAADPTAKVTTTSPAGGVDTGNLGTLLSSGAAAGADGIGMHVYLCCNSGLLGDPEWMQNPLAQVDTVKANNGFANVPTWITEGGPDQTKLSPATNENQAIWVLRYIFTNWAVASKIGIVYDKNDAGFSFLNNPKSISAVTTLTSLASGKVLTGFSMPWQHPEQLNVIRMESANEVVYALWIWNNQNPVNVTVPAGSQAYDMYGNPSKTTGTSISISYTPGPVYLKYAK